MHDGPAPRRATAPLLKDLNERAVLEAIRAGAPISRAEISRRAGISKPTVSLALQSLLDAVVGVPGVVEAQSGRLRLAANVPGLEGMPFGAELERALDLPVRVENDINL